MNELPSFHDVALNLENAVDFSMPHAETLHKRGHFGAVIAVYRKEIVRCICFLVAAIIVLFAIFLFSMAMNMGAIAANGISGRLPITPPWTAQETLERMLIAKESHTQRVGTVDVLNVIEPRDRIADVAHMLPLLASFNRTSKNHDISLVTGYSQWKPFLISLYANYTLAYVETMLREQSKTKRDDDCLCFVEYGLAENAVYMPPPLDSILYTPTFTDLSVEFVNVSSICEFSALLDWIEKKSNTTGESTRSFNKSGRVCWFQAAAQEKCEIFGVPQFQCIAHCISLYNRLQNIATKK